MADNSTVQITINVVDANSGAAVATVTKNLTSLGDAGTRAGTQVTTGAQASTAALKGTGDAGTATGKSIVDSMAGAASSIDTVTASAARAQQGMIDIGSGIEASAIKTRRAGGEMTQMLDNIHRAQAKLNTQPGVQTNSWHGPLRKEANDLGENFANPKFGSDERLGQAFADLPKKAQAAEEATKKAMTGISGHSTTALDKVRLLSQEFGLRLPRALESMLSRMPAVMAAFGALSGAVVGLAIAEVFVRAGTAIYDLQQKFISINAPAKEFYEMMLKASKLDFSNTRSIETTRMREGMSEREMGSAPRVAAQLSSGGWRDLAIGLVTGNGGTAAVGAGSLVAAHNVAQGGADASANVMKLTASDVEQTHKQALAQIELNHALDGTLSRRAQIAATSRKAREMSDENRGYDRKLEKAQGNPAPADAGASDARIAQKTADAEAAKETLALNQEVSAAIQKSRDAAAQAGLQGEALYERKRRDGIAELRAELVSQHLAEEIPARIMALSLQYDNERLARARELTAETKRGTAEAAAAGLKGIARLEAERSTGLAGVDASRAKYSGGAKLSPEAEADFAQQRANVDARANQQIEEQQSQFSDRIRDLDAARSDSTMAFNQRTDAATRRAQQEITKAWEDMYGKLNVLDVRRVQSYQALQAELGRMGAEGAREKQQNRTTLEAETGKVEDEAARRGMTREREARQAVLDEYRERYNALEELRAKDADNADLYRRQELAAEQEKNGKLIEQQRELRDKLAGQLRGLFANPMEAMKRMGQEAASKYAADLVLKATHRGNGPTGDAGTVHMGKLGELLGFGAGDAGTHGVGGRKGEATPPGGHTVATHSNVSAASTTLTTGSATITITGSATFAGGGAGYGTSSASGSAGSFAPASSGGGAGAGSPGDDGSYGMLSGTPAWTGNAGAGNGASSGAGTSSDTGGGFQGTFASGKGMAQDAESIVKGFPGGDEALSAAGGQLKGLTHMSDATMGKLGGAAGGAMGLYTAEQSNGGAGSALSGAMSGMQVGAMFGGPAGAAIGAAAGAILGFIGFGGSSKAGAYYAKEVKPRITDDLAQYGMGSKDYQSTYDDLVALDKDARQQTKQWGMGGKREWDNHIHPEIMAAQKQLDREQKAGRSKYGMTAAQHHSGGLIGDFGSMRTSADEGWIHAQDKEFMVQQQAVPSHYQALQMINSGGSHSDLANYYGGSGGGTTSPAPSSTVANLHFHSHDAAGAYNLFMDNKHMIREALNSSYAENSGGSDGN